MTSMRIGELAEHLGTTPRALRHYEEQGLLSPAREHNGYRRYDEVAVARAGNIKDLLDAGLTTQDVLQYSDRGCLDRPLRESPRCAGELETAQQRLANLDELIARLQGTREKLAQHHSELRGSVDAQ